MMIAFGPAGFAILGFIGVIGGLLGTYLVQLLHSGKTPLFRKR